MAILTAGPGKQYATISAAIAASHNGDTIQVQAGTYTNDFATVNTNISLVGVGGMVHLVATKIIPNGKAILITNSNVSITNFEFSGARVSDYNGAGIRYQAGNLTLNKCYFHDNQEGLLAAPNPSGTIMINYSEFSRNGVGTPGTAGYGQTHNLYVGQIGTLKITNSYFHDAVIGQEIKSRANNTTIENSRIQDGPNGTASYSIDLSNGGNAVIRNNVIEQGPHSPNAVIIAYGVEGSLRASNSLRIVDNTILNDLVSPSLLAVWNKTSAVAQISGNEFYGIPSTKIASGPNAQSGNIFLRNEPLLDTSHPWASTLQIATTTDQTTNALESGFGVDPIGYRAAATNTHAGDHPDAKISEAARHGPGEPVPGSVSVTHGTHLESLTSAHTQREGNAVTHFGHEAAHGIEGSVSEADQSIRLELQNSHGRTDKASGIEEGAAGSPLEISSILHDISEHISSLSGSHAMPPVSHTAVHGTVSGPSHDIKVSILQSVAGHISSHAGANGELDVAHHTVV